MREEINRILRLVEEGKLDGDQASAMIDALDQAERRGQREPDKPARAGERRGRRRRDRQGGGGAFGSLFDELGIDIGRVVEDALRGVREAASLRGVFAGAGDAWVDDTNNATLAKVEEPTGEDYKAEGNRFVVSEVARLRLTQAEFCANEMHAAALQDVEVSNGVFCDNALRGSSLTRASLTASEVTGNRLNGASMSRLAISSSVFKDNHINGARIRELDLQGAEMRSTAISGAKLKNITLIDGTTLTDVKISGVVGDDWTLAASAWSGVKVVAARVSGLTTNGANLTDCAFIVRRGHPRNRAPGTAPGRTTTEVPFEETTRIRDLTLNDVNLRDCKFTDCKFDGTSIKDIDAEGLRFVDVDFTGMVIDSVDQLKALADVA